MLAKYDMIYYTINMIKEYVKFIKEAREHKGMSQLEVAKHLGISRASYISVEQGKRELTLSELDTLSSVLGFSYDELKQGEIPDYEKYRQMILAFLRMNKNVTKTKLAKLLYFADFGWFYYHLKSMSGMQYRKISYGPVADVYFRLIDQMLESGEIAIDQTPDGAMLVSQTRSGAKVSLSKVNPEESALMEQINEKWKGKKTNEIVDFTHKQMPYMFAEDNSIVSYDIFSQENPDEIF